MKYLIKNSTKVQQLEYAGDCHSFRGNGSDLKGIMISTVHIPGSALWKNRGSRVRCKFHLCLRITHVTYPLLASVASSANGDNYPCLIRENSLIPVGKKSMGYIHKALSTGLAGVTTRYGHTLFTLCHFL